MQRFVQILELVDSPEIISEYRRMPDNIDFDTAMSRLAVLPRQQEWEEFVGRCQKCKSGSTSAEKWKRMTCIFELPE